MRLLLISILMVLGSAATAETVYRTVDENGNTIYSDQPSPDAEEIHVEDAQSINLPSAGPFVYTPLKKEQGGPYTAITITSPENDAAIRDNTGNIRISVSVEPGLNPGRGDQIAIYMDGKQVAAGSSPQFDLENIDRGTHILNAGIIDAKGKVLISSPPVSFTLLRFHN